MFPSLVRFRLPSIRQAAGRPRPRHTKSAITGTSSTVTVSGKQGWGGHGFIESTVPASAIQLHSSKQVPCLCKEAVMWTTSGRSTRGVKNFWHDKPCRSLRLKPYAPALLRYCLHVPIANRMVFQDSRPDRKFFSVKLDLNIRYGRIVLKFAHYYH
jgi:hypothetical protein